MISNLARFASTQAIGINLTESEAQGCYVAVTPFGAVAMSRASEPFDFERPEETIERLIVRLTKRKKNLQVAIGLPVDRLFFTTRPMQVGGGDASPRVLLREALFSTTTAVDEMVVDVVKSDANRRKLASIVACEKKLIEGLAKLREDRLISRLHVEPSPCAMVRRAAKFDRRHRRASAVCRLFLGHHHILAVLVAKGQPLLWRQVDLPRGDESSVLFGIVRSMTTISEQSGLDVRPESVVIHGRSELPRLLDMEWVREQIGLPLRWLDEPAINHDQIAMGLAEGCKDDESSTAFDLSRNFQPQLPLWRLFPWRETAINAALIMLMVAFVAYRLLLVKDEVSTASIRNSQSALSSLSVQDLEDEKKVLSQQVAAVQKFLKGRIVWTNYQRELSTNLPDGISMTSLYGISEYSSKGKSKSKLKKRLVLKCAVTVPQTGLIPYEVDRLLDTLRGHEKLNREFPVIELAELKQFKPANDDPAMAMFTVVCLPKGVKKAK